MKRIEDAPKELQDMFEIVWKQVACSWGINTFRSEIEHIFLKGFDTAMATGGWAPTEFKRTISQLIKLDGQIYAISNDGKLFINHFTRPEEWKAFPDLPQED